MNSLFTLIEHLSSAMCVVALAVMACYSIRAYGKLRMLAFLLWSISSVMKVCLIVGQWATMLIVIHEPHLLYNIGNAALHFLAVIIGIVGTLIAIFQYKKTSGWQTRGNFRRR